MDVLEVARFSTLTEGEVAAALLRSRGIDVRLPERNTLTIYPFWGGAFGGVRLLAPQDQIVAARALMARVRAGELVDDDGDDWRLDATPGRVGELDEGQVHGVIDGMTPLARWTIILWLVFLAVLAIGGFIGAFRG